MGKSALRVRPIALGLAFVVARHPSRSSLLTRRQNGVALGESSLDREVAVQRVDRIAFLADFAQ